MYYIYNKFSGIIEEGVNDFTSDNNNYYTEMKSYSISDYNYLEVNEIIIPTEKLDNYLIIGEKIVKNLEKLKQKRINNSKLKLEDYLFTHPLLWEDNKYYTVTKDKQTLLNNELTLYNIAKSFEQDYILQWNAKGEEAVIWTFDSLSKLAIDIHSYVKPLIEYQRAYETHIKSASNIYELNNIPPIDYSSIYPEEITINSITVK